MTTNTHYDILNVARNASSDEIRAAYTKLTQKYVSDSMPSVEATKLMKVIHNSYAILSNPIQKNKYDQWLLEQESVASELKKVGNDNQAIRVAEYRDNIYELKIVEPRNSERIQNKDSDINDLVTVSGNETIPLAGKSTRKSFRWPAIVASSLIALMVIAWFNSRNGSAESTRDQIPLANDDGLIISSTGPETANGATLAIPPSPDGSILQTANIPAHDAVAIDKFFGIWKGVNDVTPVQQSLEITLKSENSFVFRLDSKSGASIGGIYGIATFENGYAHFYNKEYSCSIIFTSKSNVIQVTTSSCQSFYRDGAIFDGSYMKPEAIKKATKAATPAPVPKAPELVENISNKPQPESLPAAAAKPSPKLRTYIATVKDADGNESTIELLAKDKDAARDIIRDFRGNPKVVKIRERKK
jgi:curved DNA-binding protein CbpA